jgi:Kdo2-lipid IVA lauroyltransferase/acyltransferase
VEESGPRAGGGRSPALKAVGRRRSRSGLARWVQRGLAVLVGGVARGAGHLPGPVAARLGAGLGELAYRLLAGRRRVALDNVARAFDPPPEPAAGRALVRASFRHLGITALECTRLFFGPPGAMRDRVRVEGLEHVRAALALGRGAFILTGHFGNWELLAAAHVLAGFSVSVIVRPLDNPFLDALLARGRGRGGLRLIPKRHAVHGIREALARGECVGIFLDQDAGPAGVFVPFMGRPASTSRGLALLALKTDAPVLPAFIRRLPGGEHLATIEAPVPVVRTGDLDADVRAGTARFTEAIERAVRAHPDQWFWVHRRWKTRPA